VRTLGCLPGTVRGPQGYSSLFWVIPNLNFIIMIVITDGSRQAEKSCQKKAMNQIALEKPRLFVDRAVMRSPSETIPPRPQNRLNWNAANERGADLVTGPFEAQPRPRSQAVTRTA
jgi:hypothetical protein